MYSPFDKQLELKELELVPDSPDEQYGPGIPLAVRWAGNFKAVIYVNSLEFGSPELPVVFTIETDETEDFDGDPVGVGSVEVSGIGVYEIPLSGKAIEQRDPDAAAIRIGADLSGGQSVSYGAFLVPAV